MKQSDSARSEKEIFFEALDQPTPAERASFLDRACAGDPLCRAKVEALLADHFQQDSFMGESAFAAGDPHRAATAEGPGSVVGPYKLLQLIGEGGCGVVYLAEQQQPIRRRVALKLIRLGMDTRQVIARFEAERQALALMDHPHIAKALDAGATESGRPYFVMELVRGRKITEFCDQEHLSTGERLKLFVQVCQAVQHAHQKGIIHRDLKPSNILVTVNDGVATPKVIDFGIAKATAGQPLTNRTLFTAFEHFLGTPAYMSPEQAAMTSLDLDARSDIYSLGVLLYELLTGQTPFDARELLAAGWDEMRRSIRETEPPKPSTRLTQRLAAATLRLRTKGGDGLAVPTAAEVSAEARQRLRLKEQIQVLRGDLDWIVMKCLDKDRARRYQTAIGLALDIQRHLDQQPVVARPPSTIYRFQKLVRRYQLAVAALAAVALCLLLGIAATTWQAIRAAHLRDRALAQEREARRLLYVADMNVIQQAWEENHLGWVAQLLKDTATSPERGFEWFYWQRQMHGELKTLRGHRAALTAVAFSPDSRQVATASYDGTAKVWDADSGEVQFTCQGHTGGVASVAFSPDGQCLATAGSDRTAKVWTLAGGHVLHTLRGHRGGVRAVAFSPDGKQLVTASEDHTGKVWDVVSGAEILKLVGHHGAVNSVAWSPDRRWIVTGSQDDTAMIWETATGQAVRALHGHKSVAGEGIVSVAISPDSQWIVTGSKDEVVQVWDLATGVERSSLNVGNDWTTSVACSPDGRQVVTGGLSELARVWEREGSTWQERYSLNGHWDWVAAVAFSPDGTRMVTGSLDQTARIWKAAPRVPSFSHQGENPSFSSVTWSPVGSRIVTGEGDHGATIWDSDTGRELVRLRGHGDLVRTAAFSPDGQRVVTGSRDSTARVWDATGGQELYRLLGHTDTVWSASFSPDGKRIVTASWDHTGRVWDAANGQALLTFNGHDDAILSLAISRDGQRILTGGRDGEAKVWELASGREECTVRHGGGIIYSVAFSPDGQRLALAGGRTATVWQAANGQLLLTLTGLRNNLWSVAFSPDGRRILTGSGDGASRLWDAATGRCLLTLKGHGGWVWSLAFSPDGRRIATKSEREVRIWEAASPDQAAVWQAEEERAGTNP